MQNLIYLFPILLIIGCSDTKEDKSKKGKWSQADMDKCVSQMQESGGKFDWDEVGVDFDTKKWATCVCKKAEKEWESFDILDRKEKDDELKAKKETKMREIFESCREDNFSKKEYSKAEIEELKRTTKLSKAQVDFFENLNLDSLPSVSTITDVNGISFKSIDNYRTRLYLNSVPYNGLFIERVRNPKGRDGWTCSGYSCDSKFGSHTKYCTANATYGFCTVFTCVDGYINGCCVVLKKSSYSYNSDLWSSFFIKHGKKNGRLDLYDSDGSIVNMSLMINNETVECVGNKCD